MRYFDENGKHNWVDENNVFVGYDSYQSCCEWADWFLAEEPQEGPPTDEDGCRDASKELLQELDWENWVFDASFFYTNTEGIVLESGGIAVFRLRRKDDRRETMYLHIFNCHNGYYGHGFELKDRDNVKFQGYL
jgi:hypothetical protein